MAEKTYVPGMNSVSACSLYYRRVLSGLFFFLLTVVLCPGNASGQITKQMWVGESYTCDVSSQVLGMTSDVSWSTNGGYFSLSGSGFYRNVKVTQFFSGTAYVTCSWKYRLYPSDQWRSQSVTFSFTCQDNPAWVSPTSMTLSTGDSDWITYGFEYSNQYVSAAEAHFESSNPACATVSYDGRVTAVAPGKAEISLQSKISSKKPYCTVTVKKKDVPVQRLSIKPDTLVLRKGDTGYFNLSMTPEDATSEIDWYSDNESIATVSRLGAVSAISPGKVTITAEADNGVKCSGIVVVPPEPRNIFMNDGIIYVGYTLQMVLECEPRNALSDYYWSSSDPSVATVEQGTGRVHAKKTGTVTIMVEAGNGVNAEANIQVLQPPAGVESYNIKPRSMEADKLIKRSIKIITRNNI